MGRAGLAALHWMGMRALYFLLAGAAGQFRYLQPGLAVILAGIAAKMLTPDLYEVPVWVSPAFILIVGISNSPYT